MSLAVQAAAGLVLVLAGILLFSRKTVAARTLRSFYWADRTLTPFESGMLMLATSLSLNGLLYQSWLGYKVGIYSAVVQAVWCAGFLLLILRIDRFLELTRDTIHGQFHRTYGMGAGRAAAIASTIGFASLAGWELSIAASILRAAFDVPRDQALYLLLLFAFVPALYTIRGGLRGNVRINIFLNFLACIGIIILIVHLIVVYAASGAFPINAGEFQSRAKLDLDAAIVALGGAAVASNLAFSFFWQTADMNLWENSSGAAHDKRSLRKALIWGGCLVFLAPGLVGMALGITVQHITDVTESNVLDILIRETAKNPLYGTILFACLVAVMLSTLDGLFLSGSLSLAADVVYPAKARKLIAEEANSPADIVAETSVLTVAYISILALAIVGSLLFLLVLFEIVDLFRMVYLAVIGQMSLVPGVFLIIFSRNGRFASHRCGLCSVVFALVGSWVLVALALFQIGPFGPGLLDWLPMITIGFAIVGLFVPNPFAATEESGSTVPSEVVAAAPEGGER